VSALLPSSDPGIDKRRTTRVVQAIPVVVRGMDALGQAFKESTATVMVNCNGCKYRSRHYVPKDSRVTVEILPAKEGGISRIVPGRVVWVQRPRTFREIFHVAVEFEVPGNVWPIESPPKDWFPHPDDGHLEVPVSGRAAEMDDVAEPPYVPAALNSVVAATPAQRNSAAAAEFEEAEGVATKGMTLVMTVPRGSEPEIAAARELVTTAVEAALAKEIVKIRERLETQMQESVQATVKALSQTIAETVMKDLVQRATEGTAALVVEARHACLENAGQLDDKIREALKDVLRAEVPSQKPAGAKGKRKSRKRERGTLVTS